MIGIAIKKSIVINFNMAFSKYPTNGGLLLWKYLSIIYGI